MRRLRRRQFVERLSKIKRWQWISLSAVILSSLVAIDIHTTKFLSGFWGILDDEIAVVTIENSEEGQQNVTITDPSKSAWDILELLGVPLVLVVLGAEFQRRQQEQSDRIAREQQEQSEKVAEDQRSQDKDEVREETLQIYFDRISTLLIDKKLMTVTVKKDNMLPEEKGLVEVATDVIRARTLSILRRFRDDGERKASVILFLAETELVSKLKLNLGQADLSGANLSDADLIHANLSGAFLHGANLIRANLIRANLSDANLSGAFLGRANLIRANLSGAFLHRANLSDANLSDANLSGANLSDASLSNANLSNTNLSGAFLGRVNLIRANLGDTNLSGASLHRANLSDTNLSGADLSNARNLTEEQLSKARLCRTRLPEGTTLDPDRDCELLLGAYSL